MELSPQSYYTNGGDGGNSGGFFDWPSWPWSRRRDFYIPPLWHFHRALAGRRDEVVSDDGREGKYCQPSVSHRFDMGFLCTGPTRAQSTRASLYRSWIVLAVAFFHARLAPQTVTSWRWRPWTCAAEPTRWIIRRTATRSSTGPRSPDCWPGEAGSSP